LENNVGKIKDKFPHLFEQHDMLEGFIIANFTTLKAAIKRIIEKQDITKEQLQELIIIVSK